MDLVESSSLSGKIMRGNVIASHAGVLIPVDPELNQRLCENAYPHALPKEPKKNKNILSEERSFSRNILCAKLIYQVCAQVRQLICTIKLVELVICF
jgi:hypothetical protein